MAALTKSKPSTTTASDNKNATPKSPVVSLTTSVSTKKGTFQWKIENYTGLRAKPGSRARTPIFSLCDEDWQLSLSPGGCRDSNNSDEAAETDRAETGRAEPGRLVRRTFCCRICCACVIGIAD